MRTIVSLDLETTGLDPTQDAIIEIGAVRFRGERVEDEFHTLVNPGVAIPPFIEQLTGINSAMVANAPRIQEVLRDLESFVGDVPILGQNVAFDTGFLAEFGLFRTNGTLDTYDLASVLLPSAGRYSLTGLASALKIPVTQSHRALDDAQTTRRVLMRLYEMAAELPPWLIHEIARYGAEVEWGAGWIFDELASSIEAKDEFPPAVSFPGLIVGEDGREPLSPAQERRPIDPEELSALIEPGGALSDMFPQFEYRSQQVRMLQEVARSLSESRHLLVEAGTGTGKSLAYLIPALAWAERNGERVVISTNTINLQDQLLKKDIPDLVRITEKDYFATALKGRGNYLCPKQLDSMRRIGPQSPEEARVLSKVLVWLAQGGSGDRGELTLNGPREAIAWARLSSDNEGCGGEECTHPETHCPYYRARRRAECAHVIVVNHALLLADIATGSRVIPEYNYLIVDEAHHLESATTNGLSFQASERQILRLLRDIGSRHSGVLGRLVELTRRQLPRTTNTQVSDAVDQISEQVEATRAGWSAFFEAVHRFLEIRRGGERVSPYGQQERILASTRTLPEWTELEIAWDNLRGVFSDMLDSLSRLEDSLLSLSEQSIASAEEMALSTRTVVRGLVEAYRNIDALMFDPDPRMIYWAEAERVQGRPSMHAAPLEVGYLVEQHLWHKKECVIMTSATLTTSGDFDYLRRRLSANDAYELALGSPFDYETSTLLYLINDIPEPNAGPGYQRAVENGLLDLVRATQGRTLVLFTSYSQLRRTSQAISAPLASQGIVVYEQGEGASRHALLESFRSAERAVLLGTRSFWEGIDVPGEALSVLVIVRLPFDVPSDPIVAARSEMYESPFNDYSVPEAILRFRQGFGRLIRTRSDRGVVVALDRRLLTKYYGRAFVDSLPNCTVRSGPLSEAPQAAARWLNT